jgi:hypothetical protein
MIMKPRLRALIAAGKIAVFVRIRLALPQVYTEIGPVILITVLILVLARRGLIGSSARMAPLNPSFVAIY